MSRKARPVWVNRLTAPHVTYHRWPTGDEMPKGPVFRTYCGLVMFDAGGKHYGAFIRSEYAWQIGHSCVRCFDEAVHP